MYANRMIAALAGAAATITAAPMVRADGLIRQLPADATWATFRQEGYQEKRDKRKEPFGGWLRMSSVGAEKEEAQPCRWIEFDRTYATGDRAERRSIHKLLIAEKYLAVGETPGEHVLRGWSRFDQPEPGEPRELPKREGKLYPGQAWFFLVGPASDERQLEPIKLEHKKLGQITCERRTGTFHFTLPRREGPRDVSGTFEARLHERAPFGVVRYEFTGRERDGREVKVTLSLDDFGPTALSALPDQK
jgi:hypothetical protein